MSKGRHYDIIWADDIGPCKPFKLSPEKQREWDAMWAQIQQNKSEWQRKQDALLKSLGIYPRRDEIEPAMWDGPEPGVPGPGDDVTIEEGES